MSVFRVRSPSLPPYRDSMKKLNKQQRLQAEFREYNKRQKRFGLSEKSFEDYLRMKKGKSRYKPKVVHDPLSAKTQIRVSPDVKSGTGIGVSAARKTENRYTGDNLLGIGTMHKSNMVPIFKASDAEDIAKMRRN